MLHHIIAYSEVTRFERSFRERYGIINNGGCRKSIKE